MGFTPHDIRAMTFWDFSHVWAGYVQANSVAERDEERSYSAATIARIEAMMDAAPAVIH